MLILVEFLLILCCSWLQLIVSDTNSVDYNNSNSTHAKYKPFQPSSCYDRTPPQPSVTYPTCSETKIIMDQKGQLVLTDRVKTVKLFDTFIFNGEFDQLDIRLHTLWNEVDYFVLVESKTSFSGKPKPLHFQDHKDKYQNFSSKIHHYVYEFESEHMTSWDREHAVRNSLWDMTKSLQGLPVEEGDILMVSDLDEIVRAQYLYAVKRCDGFPELFGFHLVFYYYSYEFRMLDTIGNYPRIYFYKPNEQIPLPQKIRYEHQLIAIHDGGWHCSYCFSFIEEFVNKLQTFSHTELDTIEFKTKENIIKSIRDGKDIYHRNYIEFAKESKVDAPPFVMDHRNCFIHLLDRKKWIENITQ